MGIEKLGIGEEIEARDKRVLLREMYEVLGVKDRVEFPGAQPVTMSRRNLSDLKEKDYYVCEKSDGIRALLYVVEIKGKSYVFLMDRKGTFIRVPKRLSAGAGCGLFDGEIIDKKNGKFVFLIFDVLISNGKSVLKESLYSRLNAASRFIYENRHEEKGEREGFFRVQVKMMHKSYGLAEVYRKIIPELLHENDGLIFTCVEHPYEIGTCRGYLKWKPPYLNTIDFRMRKKKGLEGCYLLYVLAGFEKEAMFGYYWTEEIVESMEENKRQEGSEKKTHYTEPIDYSALDGKIGEFSYIEKEYSVDPESYEVEQGRWSLLRIRTDKNTPNAYRTAHSIVKSIKENLAYTELEHSVAEIRQNWKERENRKRKPEEQKNKR